MKKIVPLFLLTLSFANLRAQNAAADKQAIAMLKTFYTKYITEIASSGKAPGVSEKILDGLQKKYCTKALLKKLAGPTRGSDMDHDPFIKARDSNIGDEKTLVIKRNPKKANAYIVSYVDAYVHKKTVIDLMVVKDGNGFKIASVW
jgi:hypothetical protein